MIRIVTSLMPAVTVAAIGLDVTLISPAFAGIPAPAPIIGAGLPVLAVAGGAYWLYRRFKNRTTDE